MVDETNTELGPNQILIARITERYGLLEMGLNFSSHVYKHKDYHTLKFDIQDHIMAHKREDEWS